MRKRIFNRIKAGGKGGKPGQWSARKAQMLASAYKKAGEDTRTDGAQEVAKSLKKWTKQKWRTSLANPALRVQKLLASVTS